MYERNDENLGIALPAIGGAVSAIGGLFSGSKDEGRLKSNAEAYNLALSNPLSLFKDQGMQPTAFLFAKSPTSKGGQGGWATSKAQNDAWTKFSSAKNILSGKGFTFNSDGSVAAPAGQQYAASAASGVSSASFGGPVVAGLSTGPLLLAGAAVLGIVMLSRGGRRR